MRARYSLETKKRISKAPVAQLDRASDFGSEGWGFKSLRAHQKLLLVPNILHAARSARAVRLHGVIDCDRFDPKKAARVSQRTRTAFSVASLVYALLRKGITFGCSWARSRT
jgi:hypothetical protein